MSDDFWESAAQADPLWAILSDETKRGRRWDVNAFFATGRREISLLMYQLRQLGHPPRTGRALDFGCGVGRLTQALGALFDEVVGVDVSPTMLRLANHVNRTPGSVRYVLNDTNDLRQLESGSFDFVYSDIVLQHLSPAAARAYIEEFLRLLRFGGITVFQLTSHRRSAQEAATRPIAMPDDAYRARLQLVEERPQAMHAGERREIEIVAENLSASVWDQAAVGVIRLGNHWLSPAGDMLIQDDGRTSVPGRLAPSDSARMTLTIEAPPDAGSFTCVLDLVHEGISWFGDKGSTTLEMPIAVSAGSPVAETPGTPTPIAEPTFADIHDLLPPAGGAALAGFPMHGVHHDEVLELVRKHGGQAFFVENDERGGPEWQGYRYFVEKSG
jgi:SAM-dependent methyltransferase